MFLFLLSCCCCFLFAAFLFLSFNCRKHASKCNTAAKKHYSHLFNRHVSTIVGLFHPYCNAGGGGERVLWVAVRAIQNTYPTAVVAIYTGDVNVTKESILEKVKARFDIHLNACMLDVIYLQKRQYVEDHRYPRFTLLGQSLGSVLLGWEALQLLVPDVFIDTMGYAFTYPVAKFLFRCRVGAYVHYPTISSDMLQKVQSRAASVNNSSKIANSAVYSQGKLVYYRLFALMQRFFGSFADEVMVNSSWTKGHIDNIWNISSAVVYPPCDTRAFQNLALENRERVVVSVAQFRPEKDHLLQLQSFAEMLSIREEWRSGPLAVRLQLIGGVRGVEDEARVETLRAKSKELGVENNVDFLVNATFEDLVKRLSVGTIGLHTMWNEHFGIGVVEYMAAGLIPLAHNTGGPKMDIVVDDEEGNRTGYLASSAPEFARAMIEIFDMNVEDRLKIQNSARKSVCRKFSEKVFEDGFLNRVKLLGFEK